ncbi:hypothetical protein FNF31_05483 [Cafeteria roenbergensis]|uniref:Farnesyl diphosphate synthase n=1 Tax=Cafeteria roenbergensis TaxID=33653 RepID=A0A5A8BZB8_CAFRO|nr:hypothetical protein FNF28_07747 [Cafeteria roenbergensis]KAA0158249.1 hypothetical protein FNF31_05483 [Cafeteria roenbergensis]
MADASAAPAEKFSFTREDFLKHFEWVRDFIADEVMPKYPGLPSSFLTYMKEMVEYTVPCGKLNRGITVVHSLAALKGDVLSEEDVRRAAAVGWCIEWLQAFFLVADDMMDDSPTRRGKPSWFRCPGVGLNAINDSFILKSHIVHILKHVCGADKALYAHLLDLFLDVTWRTELGQGLDITSFEGGKLAEEGFSNYTDERYTAIVRYKTAFYTFWLPVASALALAGITEGPAVEHARGLCLAMGEFFQIQDDFLDCFGDPAVIGKVGTDIEEGKCSWLLLRALERASPEQLELLKSKIHTDDTAPVKALYRELGIPELFEKLEADTDADMTKRIADVVAATDGAVPAAVFERLWAKTHKRSH